MAIISTIYFSDSGHTAKLAEAIHKGTQSVVGVRSNLIPIMSEDIADGRYKNDAVFAQLDASDAIIFGSPTCMGGPAAQFKAVADASAKRCFDGAWRDKLAAGFSVSGSPIGDKFSTLQYFFTLAMQHGMIWIGSGEMPMQTSWANRVGAAHSGVMAQTGPEPTEVASDAADKLTGEMLGRHVASHVLRFCH